MSAIIDRAFAAGWIAAWNSGNLEYILAHYTDDFEMRSLSSPSVDTRRLGYCAAKKPSARTGAVDCRGETAARIRIDRCVCRREWGQNHEKANEIRKHL